MGNFYANIGGSDGVRDPVSGSLWIVDRMIGTALSAPHISCRVDGIPAWLLEKDAPFNIVRDDVPVCLKSRSREVYFYPFPVLRDSVPDDLIVT